MKVLSRRLLWGACFLAAFGAVALVGAFFGRNFTGIGPTPVRSAFAGRLPGKVDGDKRRFQLFYATNRVDNEETFNGRGNELGEELLTGTFDVLISPYMKVKPFVWFDKTSMQWAGRNELQNSRFISNLREAVQTSPQKSVLIVVWGFRDWFQSAALKTAYTAYVLDINTPVVLFDWPGNQGEGIRGYTASQRMSQLSAPALGQMLATILKGTDADNVWIMGSSLGCETICDALTWIAAQPELKDLDQIEHVVLSAPDVSQHTFDEKFADTIKKVSRYLTAYVSSNDRALLMSHWINQGRRLGRTAEAALPPENRKGEYEFEEALELLDLQSKGAPNISVVDATPINLLRNLHHFFTDSPIFFDDLYQRLLQPDDIISRRLHQLRTSERQSYWILWND